MNIYEYTYIWRYIQLWKDKTSQVYFSQGRESGFIIVILFGIFFKVTVTLWSMHLKKRFWDSKLHKQ